MREKKLFTLKDFSDKTSLSIRYLQSLVMQGRLTPTYPRHEKHEWNEEDFKKQVKLFTND